MIHTNTFVLNCLFVYPYIKSLTNNSFIVNLDIELYKFIHKYRINFSVLRKVCSDYNLKIIESQYGRNVLAKIQNNK